MFHWRAFIRFLNTVDREESWWYSYGEHSHNNLLGFRATQNFHTDILLVLGTWRLWRARHFLYSSRGIYTNSFAGLNQKRSSSFNVVFDTTPNLEKKFLCTTFQHSSGSWSALSRPSISVGLQQYLLSKTDIIFCSLSLIHFLYIVTLVLPDGLYVELR